MYNRDNTRAVIFIDDIDVLIKKNCDIHIDTEMWISILGQARIVVFFLEAYIMEVSIQASILQDCMHETFQAALMTVI